MGLVGIIIALTVSMLANMSFASPHYINLKNDGPLIIRWRDSGIELNAFQRVQLQKKVEAIIFNKVIPAVPQTIQRKIEEYKIIISFEKNTQAEGVFHPPSLHPFPYGDGQRELTITIDPALIYYSGLERLIIHESFHMIHFLVNPFEKDWIKEGLAQYFEYMIMGEFNQKNIRHALMSSTTSLLEDFNVNNINYERYGHTLLYFIYLLSNCGGDDLFWDIAQGKTVGYKNIDNILKRNASSSAMCGDFVSSANYFTIARMHNKYSGYDQKSFYKIPLIKGMSAQRQEIKQKGNMSKEKFLELVSKLPPYMPILVSMKMFAKIKEICNHLNLHTYFLNNNYLYKVIEKIQKIDKSGNVLIFKGL